MNEDISFPRGGAKPPKGNFLKENEENIFSLSSTKPSQKSQSKTRKRTQSETNKPQKAGQPELSLSVADSLKYKTLQENMLVLGCIKSMASLAMEIELPDRIFAKITVNCITDTYTKLLNEKLKHNNTSEEEDFIRLKSMFTVGQFVPTKILSITENDAGRKVLASMNPAAVNKDLDHTVFQNSSLVWAAVKSELDHGYQLDVGVRNCRMFLPKEHVADPNTIVIGKPLWCTVKKCEVTSAASIVTVSTLTEHIEQAIQMKQMNLHHVIPGMQFNFIISEKIKYGLKGEFMNQCAGYINEIHLNAPNKTKCKEGLTVKARLLYIQPVTKFAYFSLRCFDAARPPIFPIGKITQVQVLSKTVGGLLVKLPEGQKGYVSYKRLSHTLPRKDNVEINHAIADKYPPNSAHQCRIIDFNRMDQIYICTFEKSIIKEKIYTVDDIKIGQLVVAKVKRVTKAGLVVKFGNLEGFVQDFHLSSLKFSENIKKQFQVGRTVQARIWNIDERGIYLTMKSILVEMDSCLQDVEDVIRTKQYPGVIANINNDGLLILFYGGLRGYLTAKSLKNITKQELREIYYKGEVIMITVKKQNDKLRFSLDPPKPSKHSKIHIGQYVNAVITEIKEHLVVEAGPGKVNAIILPEHLSTSLSLSALLLKTYKVGDVIKHLLCISDQDTPVLSLREAIMHRRQKVTIARIEDLQVGSLIRGFYQSRNPKGITVSIPFKPVKRTITVFNKELIDNANYDMLCFQPEQPLVLKVKRLNIENKTLRVTANITDIFDNSLGYALEYLEQYLNDIKRIQTYLKSKGSALANLYPGQCVKCTVNNVNDKGCSVFINKKIQGLVQKQHMPENLKPGKKMQGVILFVDYQDMFVELSLNKDVIGTVSETQDSNVNIIEKGIVRADVLSVRSDFAIAVLKSARGNGRLIFLPTRIHENSFMNLQYNILETIKVVVHRKVNNILIGMRKEYQNILEKNKKTTEPLASNRKRKHGKRTKTNNKKPRLENEAQIDTEVDSDMESEIEVESEGDDMEETSEQQMEDSIDNDDEAEENKTESEDETLDTSDNNDESVNLEGTEDESSEPEQNENETLDLEDDISDVEENDDISDVEENEDDISDVEENEDDISDVEENEEDSGTEHDEDVTNSTKRNGLGSLKRKPLQNREGDSSDDETNQTGAKNTKRTILPGINDFFSSVSLYNSNGLHDSNLSSDEDQEKEVKPAKKKKLTSAERRELARLKEEDIRKKELELANLTDPQTPDQFDRLLLGQPNNSELWAKYVAYYTVMKQIDQARNIARRGLDKIDPTETRERFNLWVVFLHLEYNYGEISKFNKIFEEAVRCNDALQIYLVVIEMLAKAQQYGEMEEKIKKARGKFKQDVKMWISIGRIYYESKLLKEARNLKDIAIITLQDKLEHINVIVQFAIMEFKYGERQQAEALFETILQSIPKRIDIWSAYVDQVIKLGDIDSARRILQRAVSQRIPAKKLKVLFQKYKQFEIKFGTEETLQQVVDLVKKCIDSQT